MNAHTTIVPERRATLADVGFIPSPGLRAEMTRFRDMRAAWDDMAAAALDFDTDRYEQAKACFNAAKEGR